MKNITLAIVGIIIGLLLISPVVYGQQKINKARVLTIAKLSVPQPISLQYIKFDVTDSQPYPERKQDCNRIGLVTKPIKRIGGIFKQRKPIRTIFRNLKARFFNRGCR